MNNFKTLLVTTTVSLLISLPAMAEEMDHSQHKSMGDSKDMIKQPKVKGRLDVLSTMTKSGQSREAGYDGKYIMETTTVKDGVTIQCAKASRGLIMLDNKTWKKCGGKPAGGAKGPGKQKSQPMDHSQHMK